jgi:hypothetical protein
MAERLTALALRTWAHRPGWKPTRKRRTAAAWPRSAFLLTTVACSCAGEPLRFGACALLPALLPGQRPADVRLFLSEDCPAGERRLITQAAAARGLPPPLTLRELVRLLFKRCYKQRLPLVGFGLPGQLGRLAAGWQRSRDGGFSLILASRPCPPGRRAPGERRRRPLLANGEIEDGDWPRITINPLDGQRAPMRFQGRGRPDPYERAPDGEGGRQKEGYVFPGLFVDLATLASVHAGGERFASAAAATAAFAPAAERPGVGEETEAALAPIEAILSELGHLAGLYLCLLDLHAQTPGGERVSPDQVYSPASYAEALLETVGFELPLAHCELPASAHAQAMGAFYGGDCGVAVRQVDVPAGYLDITGHYPVSAHLAGTFELLRATKLELVEECPLELQTFLSQLGTERLLSEPALWKRLGRTLCLVRARGNLLPHRVPHGKTFLLKTAPLWSEQPLPYLLADLAVDTLRSGLLPEIVSAFSIRPAPRRRKRLRTLPLPSGHAYDPAREDLCLALAEERLRLKRQTNLPADERERQAKLVKLIVNAACYGLLCQTNVQPGGEIEVSALDGDRRISRVDAVEEPGRWAMPLLAAGVTATGRLLLQLARLMVERAGGSVCSWDTDSLCVAATREGGLIPCRGGRLRDGQGREAIRALSFAQLAQLQAEFEQLSPYKPDLKTDPATPLLLALEPENLDPDSGERLDLHLSATAAKNYDLYTLGEHVPPTLTLRKSSEHGLGHLRTPGRPDRDERQWIEQGRRHLLKERLGLPSERPDWWEEPAISVLTLNRPGELARLQANLAAFGTRTLLCPFSRIAVAHPAPLYARGADGRRRTPVAPFHTGFDPRRARWHDLATGQPLALRFPAADRLSEADLTTAIAHTVLCDSVGAALERNSRRPEAKALDAHGDLCGRSTVGLLQPAPTEAIRLLAIGKETRNLERAGISEDPAHTLYTDPNLDAWQQTILPALRRLAPGIIPRGRPSRDQRAQLAQQAGQLARAALQEGAPDNAPLSDPEQACYLYLKATRQPRLCACGCGETVSGRARYAGPACRTRAHRARFAATSAPGEVTASAAPRGAGADASETNVAPETWIRSSSRSTPGAGAREPTSPTELGSSNPHAATSPRDAPQST